MSWKLLSFGCVVLLVFNCSICLCQVNSTIVSNICSVMTSIQTLLSVTATIKKEFNDAHYVENVPLKKEYDFVIIGGSPAGCVLANRLTEEGNYSVLLLEAGAAENPMLTNIPMGSPNLQLSDFNWNYVTEEQTDACLSMRDKRCNWPHGRGLGGSSIINYLIYTRGNPRDFDAWTKAGITGWSYDEVLPFFRKFEKSTLEKSNSTTNHSLGENGYLTIENARFRTPIADAFVQSAMKLNYSNVDYNSGEQIGVSYLQSSTRNGWRQTAAKAFLSDIKHRPNLDISLRSWASKLLFNANGDRVKGIKFYRNKREHHVRVRREAILSAGAFESPKLLMLSGIGPEAHLNEMKIKVVKDLPVGQTLYEHMAVYGPIFTADNLTDGLINMNDVVQRKPILEMLEGKGPLTSTGIESLLYMKSNDSTNSDPSVPDVELLQSFASIAFDTAHGVRDGLRLTDEVYETVFKPLENRRAFQILPLLLHPRSKGFLKLKSRNPFHHPLFYPNFFNDTRDIDVLLEGIREALRIVGQQPFEQLGIKVYNATIPGCETESFDSDDYWRCYIRHLSATLHHQIGTCKMGPKTDKTSVVDSDARVHDIKNLRVADISIIPEAPSGHTAAFSFMIGEKIADMIHNEWKLNDSPAIQNLVRNRRLSVDWLYQDPEHTTEPRTTSKKPAFRFTTKQTTTAMPMSTVHLEVLKSLNMDTLKKNSEKFKNSTIGDVGVILWGSPSTSQKIDFKTKLAEHLNATEEETKATVTEMTRIPKIIRVTTQKPDSTTSKMSNMDKIMATAPSLDEDDVMKFKLNTQKINEEMTSEAEQISDEPQGTVPNMDETTLVTITESIETINENSDQMIPEITTMTSTINVNSNQNDHLQISTK